MGVHRSKYFGLTKPSAAPPAPAARTAGTAWSRRPPAPPAPRHLLTRRRRTVHRAGPRPPRPARQLPGGHHLAREPLPDPRRAGPADHDAAIALCLHRDRRPRVVPAAGPPAHQTAHLTPRSGLRHQVLTEPRAALLAPHRCGRRVNTRREPSRNRKHSDDCVSSAPIGAEPAAQHATRVDTGDVFARAVSAGGSAIAAGSIINRGLAIIGGLTMAEESA